MAMPSEGITMEKSIPDHCEEPNPGANLELSPGADEAMLEAATNDGAAKEGHDDGPVLFRVENPRTIKLEAIDVGDELAEGDDREGQVLEIADVFGSEGVEVVAAAADENGALDEVVLEDAEVNVEGDDAAFDQIEDEGDEAEFEIEVGRGEEAFEWRQQSAIGEAPSSAGPSSVSLLKRPPGQASPRKGSIRVKSLNSLLQSDVTWDADAADHTNQDSLVALLREEVRKKDRLIRQVVQSNKDNVLRTRTHINALEDRFREQLQQKELSWRSINQQLDKKKAEIRILNEAMNRQNARLTKAEAENRLLRQRLLPAGAQLATKGRAPASTSGALLTPLAQQCCCKRPDVYYPSAAAMSGNGVIVVQSRGGHSTTTSMCIRLPLSVDKSKPNKIRILDCDIVKANKESRTQRQSTALKVIELLVNPTGAPMSPTRSQHLIWMLLLETFYKYKFADPRERYTLKPLDRIRLKPDLVLEKNNSASVSQTLNKKTKVVGSSSAGTQFKSFPSSTLAGIEKNQTKVANRSDKSRGVKSNDCTSSYCSTATVTSSSTQGRMATASSASTNGATDTTKKPIAAQKLLAPLGIRKGMVIARDLKIEREIVRCAKWNSCNGRKLFNSDNRSYLGSMVTRFLPGMVEVKGDGQSQVLVGLLQAITQEGGKVYLPFLVLPKDETRAARANMQSLASGAVQSVERGLVADVIACVAKVMCPICTCYVHEAAVEAHLASKHDIVQKQNLDKAGLARKAITRMHKVARATGGGQQPQNAMWALRVQEENDAFFCDVKTVPIFAFESLQAEAIDLPASNAQDDMVIKTEVEDPERFQCRFCPKQFTSLSGDDAHCDSAHSDVKTFACPNEGCSSHFEFKAGLFYHLEFQCGSKTHHGHKPGNETSTNAMPRALARKRQIHNEVERSRQKKKTNKEPSCITAAVQAPRDIIQSDTRVKLEITEHTISPVADQIESRSSSRGPLIPAEIGNVDASFAATAAVCPLVGLEAIKTEPEDDGLVDVVAPTDAQSATAGCSSPFPQSCNKAWPSGTSSKKKRGVKRKTFDEAGEVAAEVGSNSPKTIKVDAAEEYADRRQSDHSERNLAKRRRKHPQVAFTAILKEVVKSANNYIKTSKVVLKSERGENLSLKPFVMRVVEDRVDGDQFKNVAAFRKEFAAFCHGICEASKGDALVQEVAKDLEKFVEGELLIKNVELDNLEREIDPMLSNDPRARFNHILSRIFDEHVQTLRKVHIYQKLPARYAAPEYYRKVKVPICLEQIGQKVQQGSYESKRAFLEDFNLLYRNVSHFSGKQSELARDALEIVRVVKAATKTFQEFML